MNRLEAVLWPTGRAADTVTALARAAGLRPLAGEDGGAGRGVTVELAARRRGLEAEPVDATYGGLADLVRTGAPLLVHVPASGERPAGLLAVVRGGRRWLTVLAPDLRRHRVATREVVAELGSELTLKLTPKLAPMLDRAGLRGRRRRRALRSMLAERLRGARVGRAWLLRLPPGAGFGAQMRNEGVFRDAGLFVIAYAVGYALLLGSWWTLGRGALEGRLVADWLLAWALILLTMLPVRVVSGWSRAQLTVRSGALLKRRLLAGALRLSSDEMRHDGAGRFLGRVLESEEVEQKIMAGGFLAVVATIELALSAWVLSQGAAGGIHLAVFLLWLVVVSWMGWRFLLSRRKWTTWRLRMSHDLIERMVGHRTRLAQEPRAGWHEDEDRDLARYQALSRHYDRDKTWLLAVSGRGWVLLGIACLGPAFVAGGASRVGMAIGLGGVLAAYRGFSKLSEGFSHLTGAVVGWEKARELFRAAARRTLQGRQSGGAAAGEAGGLLLEATDLRYRHAGRAQPVLDGCSLRIRRGDRLLLVGPSGGGKSTLAAVLAGLREPDSGLLLLDGLDRPTLGDDGWHRHVAIAPQFHENHVVTESFAFNLLLGRGWPGTADDLEEAEAVCRELGLGDVLDRMPGGLNQLVGETGWQLSHGEKSRVYLARALLQKSDLLILDESFAALDAASLAMALSTVLRRSESLLVVAHP